MFAYRRPEAGPKLQTLQISYLAGDGPAENMLNQLLALLTRASPILATLAKHEDSVQARALKEYFSSSANAHWAVLLPKSRTPVPAPWGADYKKVSPALEIVLLAPHLHVVS